MRISEFNLIFTDDLVVPAFRVWALANDEEIIGINLSLQGEQARVVVAPRGDGPVSFQRIRLQEL